MRYIKKFFTWLWKTFWGFSLWVKIPIAFFVIMKINSTIAVYLVMIGVCFFAIWHMCRSLIPKKGKKK